MTPTPQVHSSTYGDMPSSQQLDDNKIVITGMSGLYPQSHNVDDLSKILYNKVNPVTSDQNRWDFKHPELSEYVGVAPDVDRFDAQFFTVYYRLGHLMDPMSRKLLEQTYQAIYDAGLSPGHLYGKKVAVFIGSSFSDSETQGFFNTVSKIGLGIVGTSKTMFANRISYWLNLKGPSLSIDEADCSATTALEQAYSAIQRGDCEAAIVGGAHLSLHPHSYIHHSRLGAVSKDGKTSSFAENSNGFTLSDAIGVVVLQKSKDALRCYAELVHVKNEFRSVINNEIGPRYGYYRNPQDSADFIKDFYKEAQVAPQMVEYVECYGTGVPDADKAELEAIEKVYCDNREEPLLVGSVTSNIGLTEAAAGIAAITKVLLGYHKGELAANLNCDRPRRDIAALREGRMRLVSEHQRFRREYCAVNGMSVTGVNSHVLLRGHYVPKDLSRFKSFIPHLVLLSGRQESSVEKIIGNLKSRAIDAEELALLSHIHSKNISGHLGRGYTILDADADNKTVSLCEKAEYFDDAQRPLWFVYSGMGSQWPAMGAQLMRIPIFARAIHRCDQVLKPMGLDIVHIITSPDQSIFDNVLNAFVGIAAIQIGLTDVLRELGLVPDGIIGHSVGELGCAYADGCMTAEEMILAASRRGQISLQTPLIKGSMAAVGLGYNQISTMCPPEIDVACRNSSDSCTISGPADKVATFVAELTAKGVFAKEVQCANIAYHSRYIAKAGPLLLKYLKDVIKNPKRRSERWLSTSVPQDKWDQESAQYCSAEYHTNNLLSPVLFEETLKLIPSNAVLVEVAPHGLLQAILKRALPADCRCVPLTKRGHADNALHMLQAIGNLYMNGYTLNVQVLYPKVQFPVSTETPMLSHLVEWVHSEEWSVTTFNKGKKQDPVQPKILLSVHDDEHKYLRGNCIRGKMCYPFAAALVAVWDMFATNAGLVKREVSVQFHDVHLYAQPLLFDQRTLKLEVSLHRITGRFEVINDLSKVISGFIQVSHQQPKDVFNRYKDMNLDKSDNLKIGSEDIYNLLSSREYKYSGEFRSIEYATACLSEAALVWHDNWATLIDGMLQLNALRQPHHAVSQPTHIQQLCIDVKQHVISQISQLNGKHVMQAVLSERYNFTRCGGVVLQNIKFRNLPSISQDLQFEITGSSPQINKNSVSNVPQDIPVTNKTLQCTEIGKLDSLQWVELPEPEQSNVTVKVHYAGLNMLDVKRASGVTSCDSNTYGMDYSGTTNSGERVMGIVSGGAASSQVLAQPELLWPVPAHWTLEDAATVPLAYALAFYALIIKGRLECGMSVLVHGGVGALGQAAIAIALAHNCQVFVTVSDVRKKQFLRKRFPQIKDEQIGNSRDISFSDYVLLATKGRGCKIVISCVKGEFKNYSLKCCESYGVVIDTAQIQERDDFEYGMYNMTKARSYCAIDFSSVFLNNNREEMKTIASMVSDGISCGYVVPLSRVTYAPRDAARALRLLAASRHRGRVLLRMCDHTPRLLHRITCDPKNCQVLLWDDDTVGAQLADRLISRGAKKLYICCTKLTGYIRLKLRVWQQLGVKVVVSTEHLTETKPQAALVNDAMSLGPVEGVYILITKTNNGDNITDVASTLQNLDTMSRLLCPQLKYFTVVSTVRSAGKDVCLSRAKASLTATYVDLTILNEEEVAEGHLVAELTERALCNGHVEVLAKRKYTQAPSLVSELAALADINISTDTNTNLTLQELGMAEERSQAICAFLNITYNISLDEADIPLLTVEKIKEIQRSLAEPTQSNVKGLATFFTTPPADELLGTTDLVFLPTLARDVSWSNEFAISERHLCIVPGMEGHHERFRALCERLTLPALVLQPGLDHPHETARDTAIRYAEILVKKTEMRDKFYILGYESGVMVALELAAILENKGLTGTVFCLGLEPEELRAEVERQLADLATEERLQEAVVLHVGALLAGAALAWPERALRRSATFAQKADACVRRLRGRMAHSAQYARALMEAALARVTQARRRPPAPRALQSRLVLLRAATARAPQRASELQRHSAQPLVRHQLGSPLARLLDDTQCPSLINRYLDSDL